MTEKDIDIWTRMYEEQVRHARHHETLRAQSTHLIVVISAALLAFLSSNAASTGRHYVLGTFLIVLNVYGLIMSLKHYERSRLHVTVAAQYRAVISDNSAVSDLKLNDARHAGHKAHAKRFPRIGHVRAYAMWSGLHLVLAVIGGFVAFIR
jgi:hypothetical protein